MAPGKRRGIRRRSVEAGLPARAARGRSGGVGRTGSELAERVSDDLRRGIGPHLRRRRQQTGLVLAATSALGIVALYQAGIVSHLPDPPLPGFDSDRVDAAGEAYELLKTSDASLGIASYGVTLALVGMGAADRSRHQPLIPILAAAKLAFDAAGAAWLTAEQVSRHRALCSYCLASAAATLAALPLSLPEAWAAGKSIQLAPRRARARG